jgi:hypothetical protein
MNKIVKNCCQTGDSSRSNTVIDKKEDIARGHNKAPQGDHEILKKDLETGFIHYKSIADNS